MKCSVASWQRVWWRLGRWARRSRWLSALQILFIAAVLIIGLPVILPLVAIQHVRDRRRRRHVADTFVCAQCGQTLGAAALERADAAWANHVAQLHREHPGHKFRLVRDLDAVCTCCGATYRYDEKGRTFYRKQPASLIGEVQREAENLLKRNP